MRGSLISEIFDSLTQCFENLEQRGIPINHTHYIGSKVTCQIYQLQQSMKIQQYIINQELTSIHLKVNSLAKEPLNLLTCNFSESGLHNEKYYFQQVGIFSVFDLSRWWEAELNITIRSHVNDLQMNVWNNSGLSWSPLSFIQQNFMTISYNKSITYIISSATDMFNRINTPRPAEKKLFVYLTLIGLSLTVILLIYFAYTRFSRAATNATTNKGYNLEETEVVELQKIEE